MLNRERRLIFFIFYFLLDFQIWGVHLFCFSDFGDYRNVNVCESHDVRLKTLQNTSFIFFILFLKL